MKTYNNATDRDEEQEDYVPDWAISPYLCPDCGSDTAALTDDGAITDDDYEVASCSKVHCWECEVDFTVNLDDGFTVSNPNYLGVRCPKCESPAWELHARSGVWPNGQEGGYSYLECRDCGENYDFDGE